MMNVKIAWDKSQVNLLQAYLGRLTRASWIVSSAVRETAANVERDWQDYVPKTIRYPEHSTGALANPVVEHGNWLPGRYTSIVASAPEASAYASYQEYGVSAHEKVQRGRWSMRRWSPSEGWLNFGSKVKHPGNPAKNILGHAAGEANAEDFFTQVRIDLEALIEDRW